jgi:hypothetical protein
MMVTSSTRSNTDAHDTVTPIRVHIREPLAGEYDVILHPANDLLDDVERFIIEHLTPLCTEVHQPLPERFQPEPNDTTN